MDICAIDLVLTTSMSGDDPLSGWLDAEGASMIGTLRKASGNQAPLSLVQLLARLVEQAEVLGAGHPAAAETCALCVAHLLPAVLRCALSLCLSNRSLVSSLRLMSHEVHTFAFYGCRSSPDK